MQLIIGTAGTDGTASRIEIERLERIWNKPGKAGTDQEQLERIWNNQGTSKLKP